MNDNIGARVRHAREQRGLSLGDAARLTKLSTSVLRAIEQNDFASLPAGMYRKAYLRTVAAEVGLDPVEIAADYKTQYEAPVEPATTTAETATVRRRWGELLLRPPPGRSIVTLIALATAAIVWFMLQPGPSSESPQLDERPPTAVRLQTSRVDAQRAVAAPDAGDGEPRVTATTSRDALKVELTATGQCWVAAESDGERVVYGLLEPGERVVVEGQRRISLRLGDAGSVQLSINDGPLRTPGGDGEVVELEVTPSDIPSLHVGAT